MDKLICQIVRSESTDRVQQKIRSAVDDWTAVEKDNAQRKCQVIQLDKSIAEAEVKKLYLQKELDDKIQSAIQRARTVNHELNKIQ